MDSSVRPKTLVNPAVISSPVRAIHVLNSEDVFRDGLIDLNQLNYILRNPELPKSRLQMKSILRQYNEEKRKAITLSRIKFSSNWSHSVNNLGNSLNPTVSAQEEPNIDLDQLSDFEVKLSQLPQELLINILGETFAKYENEINKQNERKTDDSVSNTNAVSVKEEVLSGNAINLGEDLTETIDSLKLKLKKLINEYELIEKEEKIALNELKTVSDELENKLSALRECIGFCERLKLKNISINQKQNDLKTKKCELKAEIKEINEKLIELNNCWNQMKTKNNSFVVNRNASESVASKTVTIDLRLNSENALNSMNLSETKQKTRKSDEIDSTNSDQNVNNQSMNKSVINAKKHKNNSFESNRNDELDLELINSIHINEQNVRDLEENEIMIISDEEESDPKISQIQSNTSSHNSANWRENYINIGFNPIHSKSLAQNLISNPNSVSTPITSAPIPTSASTRMTVNTISKINSLTQTPVSTRVQQNVISKPSCATTPTPLISIATPTSVVNTISKTSSITATRVPALLAQNPICVSTSLVSNPSIISPILAPEQNSNTNSFGLNSGYASNNRNYCQNSLNRNYNPNRHNMTSYTNSNNYENLFEVSHRTNTPSINFVPHVCCLFANENDLYVGLQSGYVNKYTFSGNGFQFIHQFPHLKTDISALYYSQKYNYLYCGTNGGLFAYLNNTSSDLSYDKIQLSYKNAYQWSVICFESSATILYMGLRNGFIYRFGLMSNKMVNDFRCLEVPIIRLKLINDSSDRIIVCGKNEISIRNSVDGSLLHTLEKNENNGFVSAELHLTTNHIIIFSNFEESYSHRFYVYDEKIRDVMSDFESKDLIKFVTINENNLYLFTNQKDLYCYNLEKCAIEWSVRIKVSKVPVCMTANNNRVLFGMRFGKVVQIIPDTNSPIVCESHQCGHSFPRLSDIFEHFHDQHAQPFFRRIKCHKIFTCPWIGCDLRIRKSSESVRMIVEHMKTHVV